jgi:hypothetical protein
VPLGERSVTGDRNQGPDAAMDTSEANRYASPPCSSRGCSRISLSRVLTPTTNSQAQPPPTDPVRNGVSSEASGSAAPQGLDVGLETVSLGSGSGAHAPDAPALIVQPSAGFGLPPFSRSPVSFAAPSHTFAFAALQVW